MKLTTLLGYIILTIVAIELVTISINDVNFIHIKDYNIFYISIVLVIFHIYTNRNTGYFSIGNLFILGFLIVHFQWPVMLLIFDIEPKQFSELNSNFKYLNYGVWLASISILFWLAGFNINQYKNSKSIENVFYKESQWFELFCLALLIAFVSLVGKDFFDGDVYNKVGSADAISGIGAYIHKILKSALSALIVVAFLMGIKKNISIKNLLLKRKIVAFILFVYCVSFIYAGDRGEALQIFILCGLIYNYYIKKISFMLFLILILIGAALLTVLGIVRSNGVIDELNLANLTINLANSNKTLFMAIESVEDRGLHYGELWIGSLLGSVPFAQALYLKLTATEAYLISSPGYLTYLRWGQNPHTGEGSTIVADIYLNFGIIGTCLFMFIHGWFSKTCEKFIKSRSLVKVFIAICFGSLIFFASRGTYFGAIQIVLWGVIFIYIFCRKSKV